MKKKQYCKGICQRPIIKYTMRCRLSRKFQSYSNEAICRLSKLGGGLTPLDFPIQIVFSLSRGMKLYQVLP